MFTCSYSTRHSGSIVSPAVVQRARRHFLAVGWALCLALAAPGPASAQSVPVDFHLEVQPLLADRCLVCHGPDENDRQAGLRLDQLDEALNPLPSGNVAIVPADASASELVRRIESSDSELRMPPVDSGKHLTADETKLLRRWIEQGAAYGKHWAFEAPKRPTPPRNADADWGRNAIDQFVGSELARRGWTPSTEADKTTLLRRLSFDLTGLPPTPVEVEAFLADDSPEAYERQVDRLLAADAYGERMAISWLDGARYADTNGFQNDFSRHMWPWRDWVIAAFNDNMPFDQFVIEQLAGDLLPDATLSQRIATGFNRNHRTVTEVGSIDEEWRVENVVDRVETASTVFLGLTMGCARCHDHKYDPITQKEFYEFFAYFYSVDEPGVYTEKRGNTPTTVDVPSPTQERRLAELHTVRTAAEQAVHDAESDVASDPAAWEAGLLETSARHEPQAARLRADFAGDGQLAVAGDTEGQPLKYAEFIGAEPAWDDGLLGPALHLRGDVAIQTRLGQTIALAGDRPFTLAFWVRAENMGAIISKMDDQQQARGWDVLREQSGKVAVHLIHYWNQDAIKVLTDEPLPASVWRHVAVTYDGSGQASGLRIYFNGVAQSHTVERDSLTKTIATEEPVRIGSRETALPLKGAVADLRYFEAALTGSAVRNLIDAGLAQSIRQRQASSAGDRSETWREFVTAYGNRDVAQARSKLATVQQDINELRRDIPTVMVMKELAEPRQAYLLQRGQYDAPDKTQPVEPGTPAVLPPLPEGAPANRLGLARWIASPGNPLTARVAVNRIWQRLFGVGLVKTTENFGIQADPPSHPELLDWLATELIRLEWDLKALQKQVVMSATYRQTSRTTPEQIRRDPENRWMSRGPRFRLPAELVRDNALAVSGLLQCRIGGPSVKPYQPDGLWTELAGGAGQGPYQRDEGASLYRRSLYVYRKRTVPHPTMSTFDAPSWEICQVKRATTNTPLQALALLNDTTYVEAARQLAQRMLHDTGSSPKDRLAHGFRLATSRSPRADEAAILQAGYQRQLALFEDDPPQVEKYLQHGDSPIDAEANRVELAAYTAMASVILNLDETITKE